MRDVHLSLGRGAARVHILKGISLEIGEGEAIGLVGPTGSGKSTLLMTMAGLERPDSGQIAIGGERIDHLGEDALARFRGERIGIVFQSFHLIPTMTALENVAIPLELAGRADAFTNAKRELVGVGLGQFWDVSGHVALMQAGVAGVKFTEIILDGRGDGVRYGAHV
jgi:putative ABC transport system ATP-binding protein